MKKSCCDSLREVFTLKSDAEFKEALLFNSDFKNLNLDDQNYLLACFYYASGDFEKIEPCIQNINSEFDRSIHYLRGRAHFSLCEYSEALNEFNKALALGNFRSCYLIGMSYHQGLAVKVDMDKAISIYKVGAKEGYFICKRMLLHLVKHCFPIKASKFISLALSSTTTAFKDECNETLADIDMWKNLQSRKILISTTPPSSTAANTTLSAEIS